MGFKGSLLPHTVCLQIMKQDAVEEKDALLVQVGLFCILPALLSMGGENTGSLRVAVHSVTTP